MPDGTVDYPGEEDYLAAEQALSKNWPNLAVDSSEYKRLRDALSALH